MKIPKASNPDVRHKVTWRSVAIHDEASTQLPSVRFICFLVSFSPRLGKATNGTLAVVNQTIVSLEAAAADGENRT